MARKNTDIERLVREIVALKSCFAAKNNQSRQPSAAKDPVANANKGFMSYFSTSNKSSAAAPKTAESNPPNVHARNAVQHCHAIGRLLSSYQFQVVVLNDRQQNALLTSSAEILMQCCHDENADVRIAAEEALSRLMLCYGKTHTVPLLIEFYKEIRKNGPPRALKAALKCFELLCSFLNPQKMKCKTLLFHLSQTVVKISRRDEEAVQEAAGAALPRAFIVLGQFSSEQETKAVLKTFFSLLGDENAVKRRTSGICMVSICCSCRMAPDMADWLIRGLINILTPETTPVPFTLLLGTLTCIRYWLMALPHLLNESAGNTGSSIVSSARRNMTARNPSISLMDAADAAGASTRQRLENAFLTVVFLLFVYIRHDHSSVVTHCLEALSACFSADSLRNDFERLLTRPGAMKNVGLPLLLLARSDSSSRQCDNSDGFSDIFGVTASRLNVAGDKFSMLLSNNDDQQSITMLNVEQLQPTLRISAKIASNNSVVGDGQHHGDDEIVSAAPDVIADMTDFDEYNTTNASTIGVTNATDDGTSSLSGAASLNNDDDDDDEDDELWQLQQHNNGVAADNNNDAVDEMEKAKALSQFDVKAGHDRLFEHFMNSNNSATNSALTYLIDMLLNSYLVPDDHDDHDAGAVTLHAVQHHHPAAKKASVRNMCLLLLSRGLEHLQVFTTVTGQNNNKPEDTTLLRQYCDMLNRSYALVLTLMPKNDDDVAAADDRYDPLTLGCGCQCLATIALGYQTVRQNRKVSFVDDAVNCESDDNILSRFDCVNVYDTAMLITLRQLLINRSSVTCRSALQALFKLLQCATVNEKLLQRAVGVLYKLLLILSSSKRSHDGAKRSQTEKESGGEANIINILPGALSYWLCKIEWLKGLALLPLALLNQHHHHEDSISAFYAVNNNSSSSRIDVEIIADGVCVQEAKNDVSSERKFFQQFESIVETAMSECHQRNVDSSNALADDNGDEGGRKGEILQHNNNKPTKINAGKTQTSRQQQQLTDLAIDACIACLCDEDVRVRDAAASTLNTLIISTSIRYVACDDVRTVAMWKDSAERCEPFTSLHSGHLFPYPVCTSVYVDLPPLSVNASLAKCVQMLKAHAYSSGGLDDVRRLDGTFAALAALCQQYPPLSHTEAWFGFPANDLSVVAAASSNSNNVINMHSVAIGQKQLMMLGAKDANDLLRYCLHLLNHTRECTDLRLHRHILIFASHFTVALYLRIVPNCITRTTNQPTSATTVESLTISSNDITTRLADADVVAVSSSVVKDSAMQQRAAANLSDLERKSDDEFRDQVQVLKTTVKRVFYHLLCLEYMLESVVGGYQQFSASILNRNDAALKRSLTETVRHVAVLGTNKLEGAILRAGETITQQTATAAAAGAKTNNSGKPLPTVGSSPSMGVVMQTVTTNVISRMRLPESQQQQKTKIAQSNNIVNFASGDTAALQQQPFSSSPNSALWKPAEAIFAKLYDHLRVAYSRHLTNAEALLVTSTSPGGTNSASSGSVALADLFLNSNDASSSSSGGARKSGKASVSATKFQQFMCSTLSCLRLVTEIVEKETVVNNLTTIVKSVTSLMLIEPELSLDYACSLLRKLFGLTAVAAVEQYCNGAGGDNKEDNKWILNLMDNRSFLHASSRHQCDLHPLDTASRGGPYAAALSRISLNIEEDHDDENLEKYFTFYTLCDKVQVLSQLSSKWKEDLDALFRHKARQNLNTKADRQELSNQIRTFESVVIRAMQLYTCTGDVATQAKVLSLISLLLKLRVNYSVLDGEHVMLEFVIKQIENADAGHIQRFERLIPVIFHFLLLLSREQHHVANTNVNMSKVIQLLDVLMAAELPNVNGDLICQIVFLFYKETVRRLLHARATVNTDNNNQQWKLIAEQLETEKEYLQSIILRLVSSYTCLYVLAFMLESLQKGSLSAITVDNGAGNSSAYRSTAGLVFELALTRLLRNELALECSIASFCSLDYFLHVMADELFQPPDSLLCQVFSSPSALLLQQQQSSATGVLTASPVRRPSLLGSTVHAAAETREEWSLARPENCSSESALFSMQMVKFFILKTLFERNTADDMRNGIVDWWHTAKCGIVTSDSSDNAKQKSSSDNDDDESSAAVCAFLRLHVFDDGLRQSLCGAVRTLCLTNASSSVTSCCMPPLTACYLRLFVAQCSLLRYMLFSPKHQQQDSALLLNAVSSSSDNWFGRFFVQSCRILLQSIASPSSNLLLGVHVPALSAVCKLMGSMWPVLMPSALDENDTEHWSFSVQNLFVVAGLEAQLLLKLVQHLIASANKTERLKASSANNKSRFSKLLTFVFDRFPLETLIYSKNNAVFDAVCSEENNLAYLTNSVTRLLLGNIGKMLNSNRAASGDASKNVTFPTNAMARLLQLTSVNEAANSTKAASSTDADRLDLMPNNTVAGEFCALLVCLPACPLFLASAAASMFERLVKQDFGDTQPDAVFTSRIREVCKFAVRDETANNPLTTGSDAAGMLQEMIRSRCSLLADLLLK